MVGAQTDTAQLRAVLSGPSCELDTEVSPQAWARACFAPADNVLCVTLEGCSCALLAGLGLAGSAKREAHFAGPGYLFRRAIAAATLRWGSITLLTYDTRRGPRLVENIKRRTTTLGQLLRCGLERDDEVICIVA